MADEVIPWFKDVTGADTEVVSVLTAKGWDKMTPAEAAIAATRSYRGAESLVGAPPEEIIRLPKDPNSPDWQKVHTRLGRPEKEDGYDFTTVKFKDGSDVPENFIKSIRASAFASNLSKTAAESFAKGVVTYLDEADGVRSAETATKVLGQKTELAKKWGVSVDALTKSPQMLVAQNAVRALGLDVEKVNAMENTLGYDVLMETLRNIGARMREDNYISPTPGGGDGNVMSEADAQKRKDTLMKDPTWAAKYNAGDTEARKEMSALNKIITANVKQIG